MTDRQVRETAFASLALKTRERLDPVLMAAYLDDDRLAKVPTPIFLTACRNLETASWFPKFGELLSECRQIEQDQDAANLRKRIAAYAEMPKVSPEKAKSILAAVYQKIRYDPKKGFAK